MHPARKLVNLTMVVRILVVAHHNHNELWNFFISSLFIQFLVQYLKSSTVYHSQNSIIEFGVSPQPFYQWHRVKSQSGELLHFALSMTKPTILLLQIGRKDKHSSVSKAKRTHKACFAQISSTKWPNNAYQSVYLNTCTISRDTPIILDQPQTTWNKEGLLSCDHRHSLIRL